MVLSFRPPRSLTEEETLMLPNEVACLLYAERGWYVTECILPDKLLDAVSEDIDRYSRGKRDDHIPAIAEHMDWRPGSDQVIRINGYLSLQMYAVRDLVSHPLIGATAARLARTNEIRLFHDRLIVKPGGLAPRKTETGWHTDTAYWGSATSTKLLTAWVALEGCTVEHGALAVVEGSHLWLNPCLERRFLIADEEGQLPVAMVPPGVVPIIKVLPVERGQVIFHHCQLLHRSLPNNNVDPRVALAIHLQDEGNFYRPWVQSNLRLAAHTNDILCRTNDADEPDYLDPLVFPVLWRTN